MKWKLSIFFTIPLLLSAAISSAIAAPSESIDEATALQILTNKIQTNKTYTIDSDCLAFVNVESSASFVDFIVHEKRVGKCAQEAKPIVDRFRINRNNLAVEQYDLVGNRWIAYNIPQIKKTGVPIFMGELGNNPQAFNSFMEKNIGNTVYLEIVFDKTQQPIAYRSQGTPFFAVSEPGKTDESKYRTYMIQQVGNGTTWQKTTNYDRENRKLSGFFQIGQPKKINQNWTNFDIKYIPQ